MKVQRWDLFLSASPISIEQHHLAFVSALPIVRKITSVTSSMSKKQPIYTISEGDRLHVLGVP